MQADFPVVLDACVLVPPKVCDLLLRLAEDPRLYLPKWSSEILEEVKRAQMNKLKPAYPESLADYWREEVATSFPEAMVRGYEHLMVHMANHETDRHVLAAAVHEKISTIITFNLKDFKEEHIRPWSVEAIHPQDFLLSLYGLSPAIVLGKVTLLADDADMKLQDLLQQLRKTLPEFTARMVQDLGLKPE